MVGHILEQIAGRLERIAIRWFIGRITLIVQYGLAILVGLPWIVVVITDGLRHIHGHGLVFLVRGFVDAQRVIALFQQIRAFGAVGVLMCIAVGRPVFLGDGYRDVLRRSRLDIIRLFECDEIDGGLLDAVLGIKVGVRRVVVDLNHVFAGFGVVVGDMHL